MTATVMARPASRPFTWGGVELQLRAAAFQFPGALREHPLRTQSPISAQGPRDSVPGNIDKPGGEQSEFRRERAEGPENPAATGRSSGSRCLDSPRPASRARRQAPASRIGRRAPS